MPTTEDHNSLEVFLEADQYEERIFGAVHKGTTYGKLVKIPTADKHELDGILYEADNSIATVVHVHGSLGNFYHQPFIPVFAKTLTGAGISFLSCNMRAHDGVAEGYDTEGEMTYVGGSIIRFESCLVDIQAAVDWCERLRGRIFLQGHSLGCDRVLFYLEQTGAKLSPILLSPCDSLQLQRKWLGAEKLVVQQSSLRTKLNPTGSDGDAWTLAPREAYGLKGEDGWTYNIPVTEEVLASILLGPVGRLLAVEKGGAYLSSESATAYLGEADLIRGASTKSMKAHLKVLLPNVRIIEGTGGHNMEDCEHDTAEEIAKWIRNVGCVGIRRVT